MLTVIQCIAVVLGIILVKEVFTLTKKGTSHAKQKENKPSYKKNKHALSTCHGQKSAEFIARSAIGKVITYCSFIVFYAFYQLANLIRKPIGTQYAMTEAVPPILAAALALLYGWSLFLKAYMNTTYQLSWFSLDVCVVLYTCCHCLTLKQSRFLPSPYLVP